MLLKIVGQDAWAPTAERQRGLPPEGAEPTMSEERSLLQCAHAALDAALATHGSERYILLDEALRLWHQLKASEAAPFDPNRSPT